MNQRLRKKYVALESNTQFLHPFEAYLTGKEKFGRYPLFAICLGAQHKEWETFQHIGFMHLLLLMYQNLYVGQKFPQPKKYF